MYPTFYAGPSVKALENAAPIIAQDHPGNGEELGDRSKYEYAHDGLLDRLNKMEKSVSRRDLSTLSEHQIGELVEDIINGQRTCYQWTDSFHKFGYYSSENWQTAPCPDVALPPKPTEPPTTTTTAGPLCMEEKIKYRSTVGKLGLNNQKVHEYTLIPCDELKAKQAKEKKDGGKCLPS